MFRQHSPRFSVEESACCPLCGGPKPETKLKIVDERIFYNGNEFKLSPRMRQLFGALILRINRPCSREQLFQQVYGNMPDCDWPEIKILDVYIVRLRQGLKRYGLPYEIETVWGTGWKLKEVFDAPRAA